MPTRGPWTPHFGPGPWTTFMDWVHGPPIMDRCHSVLGIPIPKTLIPSTLPKLFQTGEKLGLSITNLQLNSVDAC